MRRLFLLFFALPIINCSCPDGFELVAAGECRKLKPITQNIGDNQAIDTVISQCKALQAQPIIIHNSEQQTYWNEIRGMDSNWVPLGLTCNTSTLKWQWADGSALDYKTPFGYDAGLDNDCESRCLWLMAGNGYWYEWCNTDTHIIDIYCTVQLEQPTPSDDGCESFEDDNEDGVCYQVGNVAQNWKEAQTICRSFGANVASVHNDQENSFLRRLAVSKGAVNGVYLGASASGKGNQFGWIDGSDWDYDHFYPDSGKRVELEILALEANTCCDHLVIHENYFGSNIIANLTGELTNKFYTTASSNSMRVSWQPTDGKNVKGVIMTFRSV